MDQPCYVQDRRARHGNLIMATPALQAIAEVTGRPVPVFCETPSCRALILDAPFVEHLDHRPPNPTFTSLDVCKWRQQIPDYLYLYQRHAKPLGHAGPVPHTYVDRCPVPLDLAELGDYVVLICGSGNLSPQYIRRKKPRMIVYGEAMSWIRTRAHSAAVVIGSPSDERLWDRRVLDVADRVVFLDGIRYMLGAIVGARGVISNDTGLYHAAAALSKPQLTLWKDTQLVKNQTPSEWTICSRKDSWLEDVERWVEGLRSVA